MMEIKERLVTDEIRKLVPVLGKDNALKLSKAYLLGDEDTRKKIFELIDVMKAAVFSEGELRDSILMEPPEKGLASTGDLDIGSIMYGSKRLYPFRMPKEFLLTHIGVFGSSGYGKTNIAYWMIRQLSDLNVPVLVFDFSKRNYKDLLSTDLRDRVDIYTVGRKASPFRFNPLQPPGGIELSQWMKEFASIFDHAYWLLGGGRHIIFKALEHVYDNKEVPVLSDIGQWLSEHEDAKLSTRERNWLSTAERPLKSLCFRELGEVFNCSEGIKPSDFFKGNRVTVLELDALDTNDKTFFIEIVLQWIRDWLLVSGGREKLVGAVILEEAHHVLNREKSKKIGSETVIDLIFREIRELGLSVIYIDQHPSMVSYPALGNTSTHIYMNLGLDTKHSSDIVDAASMLGLDLDDEKSYLRKLPVGQGIVLCRRLNFPYPFLVRFPEVKLEKGSVTDQMIAGHMVRGIKGGVKQPEITVEKSGKPPEQAQNPKVTKHGWSILSCLGRGEGSFTSQIYGRVGISGAVFNREIQKLIDQGLVGKSEGKVGKNRLYYYFLTPIGLKHFTKKFGDFSLEVEMDMDPVLEMYNLFGFRTTVRDGQLVLRKKRSGKGFRIFLIENADREKIRGLVQDGRQYLCANKAIKSVLLQEAAKYCSRLGKSVSLCVSTPKELVERGDFQRVEINHVREH